MGNREDEYGNLCKGVIINVLASVYQNNNNFNQVINININLQLQMISGSNSMEIIRGSGGLQSNDTMRKAKMFLDQLTDIPAKYTQEERQQFIKQYNGLTDHEKYACAQIILSNAWGHINSNKLAKARADLAFVIPLCVQKQQKQLEFPQFEVDRMLYEAWANDKDYSQERRQKYIALLNQCGFHIKKYSQPPVEKKTKKTGFQKFLDALTCKCCSSRS